MAETYNVPELFGSCVFNEDAMKRYLPQQVIDEFHKDLECSISLSLETADAIANGMKDWAISQGATHYTHWFLPLSGETAEKHESFIEPCGKGKVIMKFSGKELIKGEPDASSFPSGGLRATFEARGYSAWDPTSSAFIKDHTLCIPTVFLSYAGHALDKKTPLLKSMNAVDRQAVRVLRLFGDKETRKVTPMVGPEQEYFLIDKELYNRRPDLKFCGRTLFGAKPPKTQELDDHYFGIIKPRVTAFMAELDRELWKVGVYCKTKHNEVAPSQHEMAPVYTDCNSANDQNQLTMDIMKRVADKHNLVCLLHEKPFAGVNGSGKHNNWSLGTDTGKNLFSPGKTPSQNAQFLLFLAAFVSAVDSYQELLRTSVAFAGNDHRLGAQEAPPAVISVFLGSELQSIVDSIVNEKSYADVGKKTLRLGLDVLPTIPQDTSDRNRTSPVAFTGNKFEFRMLGSSQSIADPNIVLNTAMAQVLSDFADRLEGASDFNTELHNVIKDAFVKHGRIIFNGNGYDDAWITEAQSRGLANLKNTSEALDTFMLEKNVTLMQRNNIYSYEEMAARNEINYEKYIKIIRIEASTLLDMTRRGIIPAISKYQGVLSDIIISKSHAVPGIDVEPESLLCQKLAFANTDLVRCSCLLERAISDLTGNMVEDARSCHDDICLIMEKMRSVIDSAEVNIPESYWPYPTYNQLLFSV